MAERQGPQPVTDYLFFKRLRELYPINTVYYPGCGSDKQLEDIFAKNEIIYLDDGDRILFIADASGEIERGIKTAGRATANYGHAPFKDEVFDALYFKDNHADAREFEGMLRLVKPGGLVIIGNTCFGGVSKLQALRTSNLKRVKLPFKHMANSAERLIVLQKETSGECKVPLGPLDLLKNIPGISVGFTNEPID